MGLNTRTTIRFTMCGMAIILIGIVVIINLDGRGDETRKDRSIGWLRIADEVQYDPEIMMYKTRVEVISHSDLLGTTRKREMAYANPRAIADVATGIYSLKGYEANVVRHDDRTSSPVYFIVAIRKYKPPGE